VQASLRYTLNFRVDWCWLTISKNKFYNFPSFRGFNLQIIATIWRLKLRKIVCFWLVLILNLLCTPCSLSLNIVVLNLWIAETRRACGGCGFMGSFRSPCEVICQRYLFCWGTIWRDDEFSSSSSSSFIFIIL
jgi:hypothetical protein